MPFDFALDAVLAAAPSDETVPAVPGMIKTLITIAVLTLPFAFGTMIARGLKMKEQSTRISLVLFALTLGLLPFVYDQIQNSYEQQVHSRKLAAWEDRQKARAFDEDDLKAIKAMKTGLQIVSKIEGEVETSISAAPQKTTAEADPSKTITPEAP